MNQSPQPRKRNNSRQNSQHPTAKHGGRRGRNQSSQQKKELLPPADRGIQRIQKKPTFKRRDYPKNNIPQKQDLQDPCPLCQKIIGKEATAIKFGKDSHPAHFLCVIRWLEENNPIQPNEKIAYIGGGKFAVVAQSPEKKAPFEIIRYLDFTEEDLPSEPLWRRKFAITPEMLISIEKKSDPS